MAQIQTNNPRNDSQSLNNSQPAAGSHSIPAQLPQDRGTSQSPAGGGHTAAGGEKKLLADDFVKLGWQQGVEIRRNRVSVSEYKSGVGQDTAFVRETLRNKLAELGLNPRTQVTISKNAIGNIEAQANAPEAALKQLEKDLNNNREFRGAFNRLSQNEPTLNYVDNVVKLNNAYGVENSLFNSLLSQGDHNQLTDIAHRYDQMRKTHTPETGFDAQRFAFTLNSA